MLYEVITNTNAVTGMDELRADALCDYLAEIHAVRSPQSGLYVRRIRELIGHSIHPYSGFEEKSVRLLPFYERKKPPSGQKT